MAPNPTLGTVYKDVTTDAGTQRQRRSARIADQTNAAESKRKADNSDEERPAKKAKKALTPAAEKAVKGTAEKAKKRKKRPDHYKPKSKKKEAAAAVAPAAPAEDEEAPVEDAPVLAAGADAEVPDEDAPMPDGEGAELPVVDALIPTAKDAEAAVDDAAVSTANETTEAPVEDAQMPDAEGAEVPPPANDSSQPLADDSAAPAAADDAVMPGDENANVLPPAGDTEVPPYVEDDSLPPADNSTQPTTETGDVLSAAEDNIPPSGSNDAPRNANNDAPMTDGEAEISTLTGNANVHSIDKDASPPTEDAPSPSADADSPPLTGHNGPPPPPPAEDGEIAGPRGGRSASWPLSARDEKPPPGDEEPPPEDEEPCRRQSAPPGDPTPPFNVDEEPFPPPLHVAVPPPPAGDRVQRLNGLTNHTLACFSNSTIQLLAACLDGYDLDYLLGQELEDLQDFGYPVPVCKRYDNQKNEDRQIRDRIKGKQTLRANIKTARRADNDDKVCPTYHLRALLHDLGRKHKDNFTSGFLWQQVWAYGHIWDTAIDIDGETFRHVLDGDRQECPGQYFNDVMGVLRDDPMSTGNRDALWSLFETSVEKRNTCTTCGMHWFQPACPMAYHELHPPDGKANVAIDLQTLVNDYEEESELVESPCHRPEYCTGQMTLRENASLVAPERLVLKINRILFDKKMNKKTGKMGGKQRKNQITIKDFDTKLDFKGQGYRLIATVFHDGSTVQSGHYMSFRKFDGDWFLIDDKDVKYMDQTTLDVHMRDHSPQGEALLLAFAKVHPGEEVDEQEEVVNEEESSEEE